MSSQGSRRKMTGRTIPPDDERPSRRPAALEPGHPAAPFSVLLRAAARDPQTRSYVIALLDVYRLPAAQKALILAGLLEAAADGGKREPRSSR